MKKTIQIFCIVFLFSFNCYSDGKINNENIIFSTSSLFGYFAISLAAINIFGGFLVTQRMLQMYKKKKNKKK